jgi:hypothetical protein
LREWFLGADPVLAWIQACVEEADPQSSDLEKLRVKSKDAHSDFLRWATREGFREGTLPAVNGFAQRLRANRPSIGHKHTGTAICSLGYGPS